MHGRVSRRRFLTSGGALGTAALGGCAGRVGRAVAETVTDPPVDVRGAIYVPTRAFNSYQMWRDYDPAVIERDLDYARRLNLNAIRTWLSYEFWREAPAQLGRRVEHFLGAADDRGIAVLLGLFDAIGPRPTEKNLTDTDVMTGTIVHSPSVRVMKDPSRWGPPKRYVRWFMERHRDDDRLLAIETANEPGWHEPRQRFARAAHETVRNHRGTAPITMGSTSLANNAQYLDWGIDALQYHYNFTSSVASYRRQLRQATELAAETDKPVWLTEWQRFLPDCRCPGPVVDTLARPDYSSLAPVIREAGVGNFFWSLMIKPAYFPHRRHQIGMINGLFHEDGAVWSLNDARAIKSMSGDDSFGGRERSELPGWLAPLEGRDGG